uniref:Copper transport protein n=2 Tax=Amanita strobiliformis TaxID=67730 RepID=K4INS5_9AGAR|nr:copper transport protein CTR1 [Amanita strobiliformis]
MEGHSEHHMPETSTCEMNMLFNWQIENTCVVFRWWHISGPISLMISCLMVFIIAALYEWIRAYSTTLDTQWHAPELNDRNEENEQENVVYAYQQYKRLSGQKELIRSSIYALLVGISFWLMLVFMTYNGYLMIATVLGAGFGHFFLVMGS